MRFTGKVWKSGDHISTDLMMPGTRMLARPGISDKEAAQFCMEANRPGWAQQVTPGDIIIAGRNFGCGSSRPAARMLKALGISCVTAGSVSRLFFRNSTHIAFPVLICPGGSKAFDEGDMAEVDVETGHVCNLTKGLTLQAEALPKDSPPYQILMAGGLNNYLKARLAQGKTLS
ncbi:MAG: 3-isopropylmalate dehydratase small subunit [Dehalococcoidia bacterium]|nr:3-isopropylmalate dehydratase small subunit [Dehalococcoidia bacterium]MDW8120538.1 3-isopropylmalate dehydratase small subunit [Chloroflexota bacterium]